MDIWDEFPGDLAMITDDSYFVLGGMCAYSLTLFLHKELYNVVFVYFILWRFREIE